MSIENSVFNPLHSSGVLCLSIGGNLRFIVKSVITYIPTQGRGYYEETPQQKHPRQWRWVLVP